MEMLEGNFNKIYHMADIHIRNTKSHEEEYTYVFNKLYEYITETKTDKSLIVICGDILHNEQFNNTSEILCIDFFSKLSKLLPTIVIAGNHDYAVLTESNTDSLQTILYKRKKELKNIYYLRETGIYKFGNIYFGVSSLVNNINRIFINADEIPNNGIKIGLYHGSVNGSKTNTGYINEGIQIKQFKNYDYVLLGDIHKYQYLNDIKTVAYSSSLISQNFSEIDNNHGILVWNLENKTSEYKIIENPYRYIEIKIINNEIYFENNKININDVILPDKAKLRLKIVKSNIELINNVQLIIKKRYPNIEIKNYKNELEDNILYDTILNNTLNNVIYNPEIIGNEINKIEEKYRDEIKYILTEELKNINNIINEKKSWRLLKLEFSNLLTYGENNIFDFENLHLNQIHCLCGPNSIGKSSLIDILLIALFDNYSRNETQKIIKKSYNLNSGIINNKYTNFKSKVTFKVGQNTYYIIKEGKIKNNNNKLVIDKYNLIQICENNEIQLSNGIKHIEHFHTQLTHLIGTYDDFCINSILFQSNITHEFDFYKMSSYHKKKFLNKHLHLEIFEKIHKNYKKKLFENKTIFNKINEQIKKCNFCEENYEEIINLKNKINAINDEYNNLLLITNELKNNKNEIQIYYFNEIFDDDYIENLNIELNNINKLILYHNKKLKKIHLIKQKNKIIKKYNKFKSENETKINKLLLKIKNTEDNTNLSTLNIKQLRLLLNINKSLYENKINLSNKIELIELKNKYLLLNNQLKKELNKIKCDYYNLSDEDIKYYNNNLSSYKNNKYIVNKTVQNLLENINCNINCETCIINSQLINNLILNTNKYKKINNIQKIINHNEIQSKITFYNEIIETLNNDIINFEINEKKNNEIVNIIINIKNTIIKLKINKIKNKKYEKYDNLQKEIFLFDKNNNELNKLLLLKDKINDKIVSYKKYKEVEHINDINKNKLTELNKNITINENKLLELLNNQNNLKNELNIIINNKNIYEKLLEEYKNLEHKIVLYTNICKLVDTNGIPLKIIQSKLDHIQNGVNNMLLKFINKKILITNEITDILIELYDEKNNQISYLGGMEYFICNIAFKIYLSSILNIPTCDILVIDEGVSALDKYHIEHFEVMINFLTTYYSKIILITHINDFKNFTSNNIYIKKENQSSYINF